MLIMSDNRKILAAKRKNERNSYINSGDNSFKKEDINNRRGIKRSIPVTPKKNLANDRMKRLRTSLNEEIKNKPSASVSSSIQKIQTNSSPLSTNARKRPPCTESQPTSNSKVPKNMNESSPSVLFKTPSTTSYNKSIFTSSSVEVIKNESSSASTQNTSLEATLTETEVMEWSPAEDDTNPTISSVITPTVSKIIDNKSSNTFTSSNDLYIVVDTNIFISQLKLIKTIIEMNITGSKKPIIFIPWMVIEELDFIKEDSNKTSLKWKAQEAIKYIETNLCNRNDRILGQTINEVNEQQDVGKSQDNKIIACCLQVLGKYQHMILLTDDINLKNKAHINHIPVCSNKEIMRRIQVILRDKTKSEIILGKMTQLCKIVIQECALKAYGQACNKMAICRDVPQSLQDCIKIFTKYWFPVFQEVLMKQFKKSIDDLSSFLTKNENITDDSSQLNDLLRLCVRVCIFLKDIDSCKSIIENTIRDLNNIKDT